MKDFKCILSACCSCIVMAQDNVIDAIVWAVGDDAIFTFDIETQRLYNQNEGVRLMATRIA